MVHVNKDNWDPIRKSLEGGRTDMVPASNPIYVKDELFVIICHTYFQNLHERIYTHRLQRKIQFYKIDKWLVEPWLEEVVR
jgi:hypothetical protein